MKIITIHLYAHRGDSDIIALSMMDGVNINNIFRDCLFAYTDHNASFRVETPANIPADVPMRPLTVVFYLNEEMDANAIAVWNRLRRGQKGHFMKLLLRSYLTAPILSPYFYSDNYGMPSSSGDRFGARRSKRITGTGRGVKEKSEKRTRQRKTDVTGGAVERDEPDVLTTVEPERGGTYPAAGTGNVELKEQQKEKEHGPAMDVGYNGDDEDIFAAMMSMVEKS